MNSPDKFRPVWISLVLVTGMALGFFIDRRISSSALPGRASNENKINQLIGYIQREYVDTISRKRIVEEAMSSIIANLDPHSAYIPASELEEVNEPLKGNFEGIGIEFNILKDTIYVVSALAGGPSEELGIKAGDRIVEVDGKSVAGIHITNNDVVKKLRGPGGSKVRVGIIRRGSKGVLPFTITRGKIPLYSVDASFMLNKNIGYIKVTRFAQTTMDEFQDALNRLKKSGMEKLILDLRGNPGGLLNIATELSDVFLPEGKLIVFTKGRSRPREEFRAGSEGGFEKGNLVVLIDEGSASASEIVAGAVQDNDRGTIVGRRSFGKGLVQEQTNFDDGSAVRLTIARYYTPTGRCIQKPYQLGNQEEYEEEEIVRFRHGEMQHADSIHFNDSLMYKTPKGKVVYGGGGIMPDVFVAADTSERTPLLIQLYMKNVLNQFSISYADKHRKEIEAFGSADRFASSFEVSASLMEELFAYAAKEKISRNPEQEKISSRLIKSQLKALLARAVWRSEGYYRVMQVTDPVIQAGITQL